MLLLAFAPFLSAYALGPNELAVLYNEAEDESRLMAMMYARLYDIPEVNLVAVSIPPNERGEVPEAITCETFNRSIYEPACETIRERGLSPQILAWAYSCRFPARVTETTNSLAKGLPKDLSLTGITFLRGKWPEIPPNGARPQHPTLYTGALSTNAVAIAQAKTRSLDQHAADLLSQMPLPSMVLAYTGKRGTSFQTAAYAMRRSAFATGTHPKGVVWFAQNNDIRSRCRSSFVQTVADRINARTAETGVSAVVSTNQPTASDGPLVGYMTGARTVTLPANLLAAGSYADHLTSFGAAFWTDSQMKISRWMEAGAAASSGTVTEPYATPVKFVSPWIFEQLLDGATYLEAVYGSVRSPLQLLPIGDPLCAPWAPKVKPEIRRVASARSGSATLDFEAFFTPPANDPKFHADSFGGPVFLWYLDGRCIAVDRKSVRLPRDKSLRGKHELRLVVRYSYGDLKCQGFSDIPIQEPEGTSP
ncbi:MAG: hypothetical protein ACI4QT_02085 [Kiritimatiellia bacterium]